MMQKVVNKKLALTTMSDHVFFRLGRFIQAESGIKMPLTKKVMLQTRLMKRLRDLGIETFEDYCDHVLSPEGLSEISLMIDAVTTNKSEFFREPDHFQYLIQSVVPDLLYDVDYKNQRRLNLWSAGCAAGEEPYTIAMVLNELAEKNLDFKFSVLATDISNHALSQARLAIYEQKRIETIPLELCKKYFLKSKDKKKALVRVIPQLRGTVIFKRHNLVTKDFKLFSLMDIIFCRNVLIYFERTIQEKVLSNLHRHLRPGGYLFTGHSETLGGFDVPFISVAPSVYRKVR